MRTKHIKIANYKIYKENTEVQNSKIQKTRILNIYQEQKQKNSYKNIPINRIQKQHKKDTNIH